VRLKARRPALSAASATAAVAADEAVAALGGGGWGQGGGSSDLMGRKTGLANYVLQILLGVCMAALLTVPLAMGAAAVATHVLGAAWGLAKSSSSVGLVVDVSSAALLYVLGKMTSNALLHQPQDVGWLGRWFVCGLLDGTCCHYWFYYLQAAVESCVWVQTRVQEALLMNFASTFFFTPAFCGLFLVMLSLLETGLNPTPKP